MAVSDFNQIVTLVKRQHAAYLKHPILGPILQPRPPGGSFSLFEVASKSLVAQPALIAPFDDTDRELKCRNFSLEKGTRLLSHAGHILSRQSENPANDQYAGAVRGNRFVASYSGDPAHIDELKMLLLLVAIGDLTKDQMFEILNLFPNKYVAANEDLFLD